MLKRLWAMVAMLVALLCLPAPALARSYSIDEVNIGATVGNDGSLAVREERTFEFDGLFNGVYWRIPTGMYEGRQVVLHIGEVGELRDGLFVPFERSDSEANDTYKVTERNGYTELKIFSRHEDVRAHFVINYTDENLVSKWEDTAELYWKFVSDGWEAESQNVTCRIRLPVPEGEEIYPEGNVRAWGHGPLDASLSFTEDGVLYTVPGVGRSEFAEARIVFPVDWMPLAQQMSDVRLDGILKEEQAWADEANSRRRTAQMLVTGTVGTMVGTSVLSLGAALVKRHRFRKANRATFEDKYFRDVPSDDHPAVLGTLYRDGKTTPEDFAASVMRLADMGKLGLDVVTCQRRGALGRVKETQDYRLLQLGRIEGGTRGNATKAGCDRVDRETLKFLFHTVARHHESEDALVGPNGEPYVLMSYFEDVARRHPEAYDNGYKGWTNSINAAMKARKFYDEKGGSGSRLTNVLAVIDILLGITLSVVSMLLGVSILIGLALGFVLVGAGIVVAVIGSSMRPMSREAIELKAKLGALRRWLKDFTRLGEAIPTDVVLWNRLLVLATALGVADEVVDQLKVAMPQLLEDRDFYAYGWYYYGTRGMGSPAGAMRDSFGQAHSVSASKLADSSSSSGSGGGGGFSSGGGGGFGGGGGGGAF